MLQLPLASLQNNLDASSMGVTLKKVAEWIAFNWVDFQVHLLNKYSSEPLVSSLTLNVGVQLGAPQNVHNTLAHMC